MDGKQAKKISKKKLFVIIPIAIVVIVGIVFICYRGFKNREAFVFADHLNDTAVTINGEALSYEELSFYVLYIEMKVERDARVYNPESPKDWWNSYLNGKFVSVQASEIAMDTAIHDYIMYKGAVSEHMTLNEEEKQQLAYRQTDFWEDLYDEQLKNLPTSRENINEQIEHIALGEKYQQKLSSEKGVNNFEYDYDGYEYKKMLESDYKIDIDDHYKKLVFGEITLHHNKTSFINGWTSESEKKPVR